MTIPSHLRLSLVARLEADSKAASRVVLDPGVANPEAGASVQGTKGQLPVDDLVANHADAVYRYALRLTRSRDQAEELTQETLLRGWQRRGKLREPAAARVWLLRIGVVDDCASDGTHVLRPCVRSIEAAFRK